MPIEEGFNPSLLDPDKAQWLLSCSEKWFKQEYPDQVEWSFSKLAKLLSVKEQDLQ